MSKDKKRKFQAIINQNQPVHLQNSENIEFSKIEETTDKFLRNDLLKVFILTISIIAIYIVLYFYDKNTGYITQFAEHISSYIIK